MITIYGKEGCTFCDQAKALCESKGVGFKYLTLGVDYERESFIQMMQDEYNIMPRTMPQIVDGDVYIGGFTELKNKLLTSLL